MSNLKIISTTDGKYIGTIITVVDSEKIVTFGDFYVEFDRVEKVGTTHRFISSNYLIEAEEV